MINFAGVFLPAAILFACSPGAGNLLALRNGARYGTRLAILGFSGRFLSFLILFATLAIGLAAVIASSPIALTIIKWCGVAYLVWLGAQTLWLHRNRSQAAVANLGQSHLTDAQPPRAVSTPLPCSSPPSAALGLTTVARQEFLTSITNPKAILLVTAFLPQFVVPGTSAMVQLFSYGAVYITLEFTASCVYARVGAAISGSHLTARARQRFGQFTGLLMLGTGAWLATFSAG